jgi:thymidine kinase
MTLIIGPMFSGKTSTLISKYDRYKIAGKKCIMVKYIDDNRYDQNNVVTHNGIKVEAVTCRYLFDIEDYVKKYNVICIDEVQFYKDAPAFCEKLANEGHIVIASGLNGNYKRKPFEVISNLIPIVEDIIYLKAICIENGKDAYYSKINTVETDEIVIGGSEKYSAVDRETYFKK